MLEPVTVDAADLRTVLAQRIMHSHERPGVWDADNRPGLASTPCVECAARTRLREALAASGGPGSASPDSPVVPPPIRARIQRDAAARERIDALIEASSLGTPEAKALRESVPDERAAAIVERSKEIRDEGYPTPDRAAYAAYQRWRARPNRDAYVHDAMLALATEMFEAGRVVEGLFGACGHPCHGGDGGACPGCGFDVTKETG